MRVKTCYFLSQMLAIRPFILVGSLLHLTISLIQATEQSPDTELEKMLESGMPLMRVYSSKEYGAYIQNWAVVQAPNGMMYMGNGFGVLEFDGLKWRLIKVPNNTLIRSLAVDPKSGTIYVGAFGEFGYLAPDDKGELQYVSYIDRVPESERNFSDVWKTTFTEQGVIFSSNQRIFRVTDSKVESWTPQNKFHFIFKVGKRVFMRDQDIGLTELIDGNFELVAGGERFANERIYGMVPWSDEDPDKESDKDNSLILVGSRTQGFFLYDGSSFTPWKTEADEMIKQSLLYDVKKIDNNRFALATLQGGLFIIDKTGRWLKHIDESSGLSSNMVTQLHLDHEGGLWLALGNGLARTEVNNPLSFFSKAQGLKEAVFTIERFQGKLYVGTASGLYQLKPGVKAEFVPIPGIEAQIWDILPLGDKLLVSAYSGVYEIHNDQVRHIYKKETVSRLAHVSGSNSKIIAGKRGKVAILAGLSHTNQL